MTLPANVPTSLVQGTYSIVEADNADTGIEPQGAPLDGLQIVLTPDPPRVWTHTSSGAGVAIGPMLATTNSLGVLVNPVTGLVGLRIPSSAQAGLTGAPTIPWTAEVSDPLGRVETERKTFHAPADGTVNLPSAAPYWPDPNAGSIPQWEKARDDARAAVDAYAPQAVEAQLATRWRLGIGSPNGIVTAPPGTHYVNTSTAVVYVKTANTTAWGWRTAPVIREPLRPEVSMRAEPTVAAVGSAYVTRTANEVHVQVTDVVVAESGQRLICVLPAGYTPIRDTAFAAAIAWDGSGMRTVFIQGNGRMQIVNAVAGVKYRITLSFLTADLI